MGDFRPILTLFKVADLQLIREGVASRIRLQLARLLLQSPLSPSHSRAES